MSNFNAHSFRDPNGVTHVVGSTRSRVSRRRTPSHRAFCGVAITPDFQRRNSDPNDPRFPQAASTCDVCTNAVAAIVDIFDTDFGFHGTRDNVHHPHVDCASCGTA